MEPATARLSYGRRQFPHAPRLIRNLRRPRIAAAAIPNSAIIGGAGTSVPLLLPELEVELELDVLVEEELEVEVEDDDAEDVLLPRGKRSIA